MESIINSLKEIWNKLPKHTKIGGTVLVAAVFLSLIFIALFSSPDYQILYSDLTLSDAAEVVSILNDNGVPYEIADNGGTIKVPTSAVHETRFMLAGQGLPTGGIVGYETFNSTRLGETEADRELRMQIALEGELTRTIRTLNEVDDARVHLVIPARSLFIQQAQPSKATVVLTLKPSVVLTDQQVKGITHLLATSVERLVPENITILDTRGNVLNDFTSTTNNGNLITQRLEIESNFERQLSANVTAMLERIYGYGNVISLANVDLDFDTIEQYNEIYTEPTRDGGLVRSQQNYSEFYFGDPDGAIGIPGVESNIPGYVQILENSDSGYYINESIINYELNRSEVHHTSNPGAVRRLSISVWINGELSLNELEAVEASVISALGMNTTRGDSVSINSVPFESDFRAITSEEPVSTTSYLWLVIVLSIILIIILVVAIIIRARQKAEPEPETTGIDIIVDDQISQVPEISPEDRAKMDTIQRLKSQIKDKPDEFVKVLKSWLVDD